MLQCSHRCSEKPASRRALSASRVSPGSELAMVGSKMSKVWKFPRRRLAGFGLQEPLGQKRGPSLLPDDPVDGQVLVLLIVFDRRLGGCAKVAVLDQDGKAAPLIQHE